MIKAILIPTDKSIIAKLLKTPNTPEGECHDIILIDTEAEIVKGDWFIVTTNNLNEIHQFGKNDKSGIRFDKNNGWAIDCKKIISSTNESHKIPYLTSYGKQVEVDGVNQVESLPQLSPKSIQLLIDYYNEHKCMPESVKIEWNYQPGEWLTELDDCPYRDEINRPVLNQQGEIDITIPGVEEKLYTRADIMHAFTSGHNKARTGQLHSCALLDFKKEQNL